MDMRMPRATHATCACHVPRMQHAHATCHACNMRMPRATHAGGSSRRRAVGHPCACAYGTCGMRHVRMATTSGRPPTSHTIASRHPYAFTPRALISRHPRAVAFQGESGVRKARPGEFPPTPLEYALDAWHASRQAAREADRPPKRLSILQRVPHAQIEPRSNRVGRRGRGGWRGRDQVASHT